MEFKGKIEGKDLSVPPCLWKGEGGVEIRKEFRQHDEGLACDFYLQGPFAPVVAEVKVAVPQRKQTANEYFKVFKKDL